MNEILDSDNDNNDIISWLCVRLCLCIFAIEGVCECEYVCLFLCEYLEDDMRCFL